MNKSIFISILLLLVASTSISQSISEKLIKKAPKKPTVLCANGHCDYITYSCGGNVVIASVRLHGESFLGWRPPCLNCSYDTEDYLAAEALEEQVKRRFPDAKTGFNIIPIKE
jgi:hypothetical protein